MACIARRNRDSDLDGPERSFRDEECTRFIERVQLYALIPVDILRSGCFSRAQDQGPGIVTKTPAVSSRDQSEREIIESMRFQVLE